MRVPMFAFVIALLLTAVASAQTSSKIQFTNYSREDCMVKLVGPPEGYITVRNNGSAGVPIRDGQYHIVTRYGDRPGNYRYSRGEAFTVYRQRISITLHKVANGNYRTRPAAEREFSDGQSTAARRDSRRVACFL